MNRKSFTEERPTLTKSTVWMRFMRNINYFLLVHPFKGSGMLRELGVKLLASKPKGPTIISTKYGFDIICMDPIADKGVEKPLYLNGTYEAGTLDVIKKSLREGDTFIDVGANIGLMSLFASEVIGNNGVVYSFEPEPETFMILKENVEINKVNNIRAYNVGLGNSRGKSFIYTNSYAGRGSASLISPPDQNNSKKYEIYLETLDDFILKNDIANIRMLKIDVEGWELHVLRGAKSLLQRTQAPIICIEYSKLVPTQSGQPLDIYYYILSVNNYSIYKLKRGKGTPSKLVKITDVGDLPDHDNLFCFLPSHLRDIPKNMFASDA